MRFAGLFVMALALLALAGCGTENTPAPQGTVKGAVATPISPTPSPVAASPTPVPATSTPVITPTATQTTAAATTLANTPEPTPVIAPTPTPYVITAIPVQAALPTSTIPVPVTVNGDVQPDQEELAFLQQLNAFRQANGRSVLAFEPSLYKSAHWMAQDMATKNYVSHTDSQGRDISTRIKSFGYPGAWVGENIAGGLEKADDNLKIWQSDDIHRNNLLGANYKKAAAARYYFKDSLNHWYWVLDLGA